MQHLAGDLHCRRSAAEAPGSVPVLAPQHQPEEARGGAVFASRSQDDNGEDAEALRAARGEDCNVLQLGFPRSFPSYCLDFNVFSFFLSLQTPTIAGVRPATAADVPAVTKLLNAYLKRFPLHPGFTEEEVHHWLLPREGVIDSYVVDTAHALAAPAGGDLLLDDEDEEAAAAASSKKKGGKGGKKGGAAASAPAAEAPSATAAASSSSSAAPAVHPVSGSTVTDFISFYHLPSTIIGHEKHKVLSAVYSYYNVPGAALVEGSSASAGSAHGHSLETLFTQAMILGKQKGVDVFNALDLMDNTPELMKELKFAPGDGKLNYYLYNWKCPDCTPRDIGLVLL